MDTHNNKKVLELQRALVVAQQNIQRLYSISSQLYQEIIDLKRHTNYKNEENLGEVPRNQTQRTTANADALSNLENMVSSIQQNASGGPRKLKVINN